MRPRKENHQLGCPFSAWIWVTWLQPNLLTGRRPESFGGDLIGFMELRLKLTDALRHEREVQLGPGRGIRLSGIWGTRSLSCNVGEILTFQCRG